MEFSIAKACASNLEETGVLYGAVCDSLADKPYNPGWRRDGFPTAANAKKYLETGTLLLARANGILAGSVAFTPNPSAEEEADGSFPVPPPSTGAVWYIHVLAVHPDFLRQGVASQLLDAAGEQARAAGVSALRLYVWEGNTVAIHAYEKNGYLPIQAGVDIGLAEFGLERFTLYEKAL